MVFGLIRNKQDDTNFHSLQESENFSYFDDATIVDDRGVSSTEGNGASSLLNRNSLLTGLCSDDYSESELDTKLLNDLMARHVPTHPASRSSSLVDVIEQDEKKNEMHNRSQAQRTSILRAPSLEVDRGFDGTLDNDDTSSYDGNSIESELYNNDANEEPIQLEIPGITAITSTKSGRNQNSLDSVTKQNTSKENNPAGPKSYGASSYIIDPNASIAFTTCFDHHGDDTIIPEQPYCGSISIIVENISIDIKELESEEVIDKETVRKIYDYALKKADANKASERRMSIPNTTSTASNDNSIRTESQEVAKTTSTSEPNQLKHIRSPTRRTSERIRHQPSKDKELIQTTHHLTNSSDGGDPIIPKPGALRRRSTSGVANLQLTINETDLIQPLPRERRKSLHTSPERRSASKGVRENDLTSSGLAKPHTRRNSTTGSAETDVKVAEHDSKMTVSDDTEEKDPSPSRRRDVKNYRSSPERRSLTKEVSDGSKKDATEHGELNRHSYSSPKKGKIKRNSSNDKSVREKVGSDKKDSETNPDLQYDETQNTLSHIQSDNNTLAVSEGDIITTDTISSPTKEVDERKQKSILGNTGKMIKLLSQRMLNQDKDRPSLVKSESQPTLLSTRMGSKSPFGDNNPISNAESLHDQTFDEIPSDGGVPMTPRSQKRFLNWRLNGPKKQTNHNLIEGELEMAVPFDNVEGDSACDLSNEFTVQDRRIQQPTDAIFETRSAATKVKSNATDIELDDNRTSAPPGILRKSTHKPSRDRNVDPSLPSGKSTSTESNGNAEIDRLQSAKDSLSPTKAARPKGTGSAGRQRKDSPSDKEFITVNGQQDQKKDSQNSQPRVRSKSDDQSTGPVVDSISMNPPEAPKSPAMRRRSTLTSTRGLSQSVHVSPAKRGKGSSSVVSRRLQVIALTTQDDGTAQINTSSSNNNSVLSGFESKELGETADDTIISRDHKNLSQSLHSSPVKRKMGKNTEIPVKLESEMQSKGKMTINPTSSVEGANVEMTNKADSIQKVTRVRKTTVDEFKKEFVNRSDTDNFGELPVDENGGKKQRPLINRALNVTKMLNNKP